MAAVRIEPAQQHEQVVLERLVDQAGPQDRIGLGRTAPRGCRGMLGRGMLDRSRRRLLRIVGELGRGAHAHTAGRRPMRGVQRAISPRCRLESANSVNALSDTCRLKNCSSTAPKR